MSLTRRNVMLSGVAGAAGLSLGAGASNIKVHEGEAVEYRELKKPLLSAPYGQPLFEIGLAQWSLNTMFRGREIDNLDFGPFARNEFGIGIVEWVSVFFQDKVRDLKYLRGMKQRADDAGVRTNLIMVDRAGALGDTDPALRQQAVENHYDWVVASKLLGADKIRVNARSNGTRANQKACAVDGLRKLTEFARGFGVSVIVENHGGFSSNGYWLAEVIEEVGMAECGTLPDFGNCNREGETGYYETLDLLMPYARAVSAKSYNFNDDGSHIGYDFERMLRMVNAHKFFGVISIESTGDKLSKIESVRATQELLIRIRTKFEQEIKAAKIV